MERNLQMSLYDCIIDMYQNSSDEWNYYGLNISVPFNCTGAKEFIKQYFEQGAKKRVILPVFDEINTMRIMHTISAYFIGLLLKKNMGQNLNIKCSNSEDYEFSYLWFLVCLYHDMGYAVENDWKYKFIYRKQSDKFLDMYPHFRRKMCRQGYEYKDLGLVFVAPQVYRTYFSTERNGERNRENDEGIVFGNGIRIEKSMYSRKTVLNYLEYCKMTEEIRHYDHGIVGGFWLYDSLMKNYYKMYVQERKFDRNIEFNNFKVRGYWYFSEDQWRIFAYLADCIISHNIWPASDETYEIYKKCDLNQLIEPYFKKIAFRDNPILFILAIADTIEPIKLYSEVPHMQEVDIWRGIDMLFQRNSVIIKLLDDRLKFERLENKIKGLENWMDVDVSLYNCDKKIIIEYN